MEDKTSDISLLRTKLYRPPVPSDHVDRPELIKRLEKGRQRPLTLVSAPAGYGKSTLVSAWLETCGCPSAWVSLDEDDNDLRQFLSYFLAALRTIFPASGRKTQVLLNTPDLPPVSVLARSLTNELDQTEQDFILVLDDMHRLREESVHELLSELLQHPPPPMHLVLAGRHDPFLPISNLRARGQVTEIRLEDLRFRAAETAAFLQEVLGDQVDEVTAAALTEKAEGWVAALRLAVLVIRRLDDATHLLELKGTTAYVTDYLIGEVLNTQSPVIRHYLVSTSIVDRFCAPLCDVLCQPDAEPGKDEINGQGFMSSVQQSNLFVIPLDTENRWFRYHHLFQDLLQTQLKARCSPEEIATLHSRSSAWFEAEGLIDEALKHALAAEDIDRAAQLVERNRESAFNADRWYILERWLSLLPDRVVQQRIELLLARAWVAYFHLKFEEIPLMMDQVDALLGDDTEKQSLYGESAFFRGCIAYFQNDGACSVKHLQDALERIPVSYYLCRGEAEVLFGLATQMVAGKEQAIRKLDDLLKSYPPPHDLRRTRLLAALVYVDLISGDLAQAETYNRLLHETSVVKDYAHAEAWSAYLQGLIHLYRYELDAAIQHLKRAAEQRFIFDTRAGVDSLAGLVFAYQALGRPDQVKATLQLLREYTTSLNDPAYSALADSFEARLSIMQGRLESAISRLGLSAFPPAEAMLFWLEIPSVTRCRALIAKGSTANLREAEERLGEYAELNEAYHNTCQLIGILSLQAMALEKQHKRDEACAALERALMLARPGGLILPFVELGPPMADLLKRLIKKNVAVEYIDRILAAFRDDKQVAVPEASDAQAAPAPSLEPPSPHSPASTSLQPLDETLTNRELQILELLAQRLQNKEIAEKLFISVETVKAHLKSIYLKLDVSTRRQAITRAKALGILTGS
jgi:LuxR family maltose regulon positive regulatory protein